jgi:uncharacterized protein YegL
MSDILKLPVQLDLPPEEPGPFAPCILLLDTSASMQGAPIGELNAAVEQFAREVRDDSLACNRADICVIEIKDTATQIVPPTLARDFEAPKLTASGRTGIGDAILLGLRTIRGRRAEYLKNGARAYKPMVFLLTDGMPTDDWQAAAQEVRRQSAAGRLNFFAVGTSTADFDMLRQIAPPERPPMMVKDGCFRELFTWISDSLSSVSGSMPGDKVSVAPANGWGELAI